MRWSCPAFLSPLGLMLSWAIACGTSALAADDDLADARGLWLSGKYAEALEAYEALAGADPVGAALGIAHCHASLGQSAKGADRVAAALKQHGDHAELHALAASLALARGDYPTADAESAEAIKLERDQLRARWVQAERYRLDGKLEAADAAYKWFIDYYNDHDVERPEDLVFIGRAAAMAARWNRWSDQFTFLVNELYPSATELDEHYWPAHYEAGL
ncbi:MAG TPA: tetratricopeptide repeat protein, partial [Pirellulales bacterium]|nr:tetratricopeptide repeat protein [Pirellulales bacterium]